jgi:hypothetical protein
MASLDRKLDRRRCRHSRDAERCVDCGCRGTGGWRDVDGRRRYVSVSSQSDTEQADLARERKELSENPGFELEELADIYVKRSVDQDLAWVALGCVPVATNALAASHAGGGHSGGHAMGGHAIGGHTAEVSESSLHRASDICARRRRLILSARGTFLGRRLESLGLRMGRLGWAGPVFRAHDSLG